MTSLNPNTCVYTVEYGTPAFVPYAGKESQNSEEETVVSPDLDCNAEDLERDDPVVIDICGSVQSSAAIRAFPGQGSRASGAKYTHNNHSVTYTIGWEDPVGITVNWSRSAIRSNTSGSYIVSVNCLRDFDYFWEDGWEIDDWATVLLCENYGNWGQSYVEREFSNYAFCPSGNGTLVNYVGLTAYVEVYGTNAWINDTWAEGGCSYLLDWWWVYDEGEYY